MLNCATWSIHDDEPAFMENGASHDSVDDKTYSYRCNGAYGLLQSIEKLLHERFR